ncbi:MAG TPA: glycoside hydrolase family 9 protein [Blastocatellia bacterium]|nr:glycoside hydrolase family 9 protein [Blastocatellia bacterium]
MKLFHRGPLATAWRSRLGSSLLIAALALFSSIAPLLMAEARADGAIFIRMNQTGFRPRDVKTAVAFARSPLPQGFTVIDAATGQAAFKGEARQAPGRWGEFEHHTELDFSALKKPGRYFLRLGEVESHPFQVGDDIYNELPDQLLEFMRQQRCGYNPWLDAVCHSYDGRTAYGPLPAGTYLNATGGWHDAGDLLKYLLTSSNATAQMLLAYQLERESPRGRSGKGALFFQDRFNDLGQMGANGIPDILDEARWGLDWMLKLHPAPDQLYHQVADDRDHKGWRLPQNEIVDYGWGPGSYRVVYFADGRPQGLGQYKSESNGVANLAGRYAAAMALGYQVWKDDARHRQYAERLLQAAKEVYALGKAKEGVQQGNSYGAPYRYEETTWADDMEWGAAELLRATGDRRYLEDARRYARLARSESWMGIEEAKHYQYYPFMNAGHFRLYDLADRATRKALAGYYREGIERCVRAGEKGPYSIGVPFIWCSNNLVVALATQCLLYERMTGDTRFREFASKQRDWLLGRNPWGYSMFTEIPADGRYPKDVHLMANSILKRTIRGGLVDGPVYRKIFQSLKGVSITEPDPLAAFQDERAVYHDDIKDYSTNEPTMDGTASAILLWALEAGGR